MSTEQIERDCLSRGGFERPCASVRFGGGRFLAFLGCGNPRGDAFCQVCVFVGGFLGFFLFAFGKLPLVLCVA